MAPGFSSLTHLFPSDNVGRKPENHRGLKYGEVGR